MKKKLKRLWGRWSNEAPAHRYSVLALCVIGTALRIAYLFQPMHYEESLTYIAFVSRPLSVGLSYYPWPNNHLFNTLLSHLGVGLLGNQPWIIRLPSFLFGLLILPATYLVVRRLYNKHAALIALALAVPSSQLIGLSTQARGYTIQAFLFLTLILSAISILRGGRLAAWSGFVISAVLGFYTMPTMLYFFPPVLIWLAWSAWKKAEPGRRLPFIWKCAAACAAVIILVALLYLPVILNNGLSSITNNRYVASLKWTEFMKGLPGNIYDMWSGWNVMVPFPIALLILAGFAVGLVYHRRISKFPVSLPLITMVWCVLLMNVQRALPFARNWLPLFPLYLGCASAGLVYASASVMARLRRRGRFATPISAPVLCVTLLILTLILSLLTVIGRTAYQKDELGDYTINTTRDAEAITLFLKDQLREGDIVYSDIDYMIVPLEYYFLKYDIPLDYLVMKVPDVEDFPVGGSQEEQRATWDPLGRRPGGPEGLQRAFFIVADKEGHTWEASLEFALTEDGGFNIEAFNDYVQIIMNSGFSQLSVTNRNTGAGGE
jgi:hypothetical protein